MSKVKKQHYVWEHHLRAWARGGEQVWCQRNGGEPFRTHTENIGQQRYFYRLREIDEKDLRFVERTFIAPLEPLMREMARGWIAHFTRVFDIQRAYTNEGVKRPEVELALDTAITNFEEDIHSRIETQAIPILEDLRAGAAAFAEDPDKLVAFMWFIAAQYMRTAKVQSNAIAGLQGAPANVEAVWGLIRTILSSTLGNGLFLRRANMRLTFLEPANGTEFITGDQPLINIRADGRKEPPSDLEFYYPLSPERALFIGFDAPSAVVQKRLLSSDETIVLNKRIFNEAREQRYAASKEALASLA